MLIVSLKKDISGQMFARAIHVFVDLHIVSSVVRTYRL